VSKIQGFYWFRDDEWGQKFDEFIKTLEDDPAKKDVVFLARSYWFPARFYSTLHCNPDQSVERFLTTHRLVKEYIETHLDHPQLNFLIEFAFGIQREWGRLIESSPTHYNVKKGTLMLPTLEFHRYVYAVADVRDAAGWLANCDRELVKYRILAADEPMAAFRKAVDEKKTELEKNLDKDSRMNLFPLEGTAEEMEQRADALRYFYTTLRPVFAACKEEFAKDDVEVYDMLLNALALIGKTLELEAVLLDGTKVDLKNYRGKVVLLEYWNTGCGPCIGEFPSMKRVYQAFHDRGFEIIAFSTDDDLDVLKAMIEKEQLPWLNASEKLSLAQKLPDSREKYKINAFPTSILIDREGVVVRADARGSILYQELNKLFPPKE
jgi:thiol-disulfide isomerase/thioredoxin